MTYAKLISSTTIDRNPPRRATIDGRAVAGDLPADYLAALGYYPLDESAPEPQDAPEGHHYEARYAYDDDETPTRIVQSWVEVEDPPPPPRVFRRSYLAQWIRGAGKWDAFSAFLAQPAAADLAFLWEYCTEFDEDNTAWPQALAAIKAALSLTDEEADAMLNYGESGSAGN